MGAAKETYSSAVCMAIFLGQARLTKPGVAPHSQARCRCTSQSWVYQLGVLSVTRHLHSQVKLVTELEIIAIELTIDLYPTESTIGQEKMKNRNHKVVTSVFWLEDRRREDVISLVECGTRRSSRRLSRRRKFPPYVLACICRISLLQ